MRVIVFCLLLLMTACQSAPTKTSEKARITRDVVAKLNSTVFEVVTPKNEDSFVKFDRPLPLEKMDYLTRTDKYVGLGTAFAIGPNRFVSAAHVFSAHIATLWKDYFIRSSGGRVFKIKAFTKYSQVQDVVEFTVEDPPHLPAYLQLSRDVEVGDMVFTVGNAQGQGISVRGGDVASFTPEPVGGAWTFIRFSAPASPGNSGGPLVNEKGEVVGIVQAKTKNENLNFALPISEFLKVADKAVFRVRGAGLEVYEGYSVTKDWSFETALPLSFSELNALAEKEHRAFRRSLYDDYYKKYASLMFKENKALDRLLRVPVSQIGVNGVLSFVFLDKDGRWKINTNKIETSELASDEALLYFAIDSNVFFHQDKPKKLALESFVNSPALIMERFLKGYPQKMQISGESLGVVSLGEPTETVTWFDSHGRSWRTYQWKLKRNDMQYVLHCTPEVEGVTCRFIAKSTGTETFDDGMAFRELADRILIHYGGTTKSWKEFLQLGKAHLPKEFEFMTVEDSRQLKVNVGRIHYESPMIPVESKISIFTTFDPLNRSRIIPSSLVVSRDLNKETYDVVTNVFKPNEEATQEEKRLWGALLSKQTPFDGTIRSLGNHLLFEIPVLSSRTPSAAAETVESAFVFSCTRSSKLSKQRVLDECTKAKSKIGFSRDTSLVKK